MYVFFHVSSLCGNVALGCVPLPFCFLPDSRLYFMEMNNFSDVSIVPAYISAPCV